jgi:hypothetical protein
MDATHQFLTEILNQWRASGGGITGDMQNNFYLSSPQIPQFTDPRNNHLYPHIHIILNSTNCMFVVSCNSESHGKGSDISPNVFNPATGRPSTVQDYIDFFMLRLRQCPPAHAYAPAPAPVFSGFGAAAPAAAPATNPLAYMPRAVAQAQRMRAQAPMQAQAPIQTDDSMNGGKRRMIKKTKTQRRRCARRRSNRNRNRSRRTKRSKSN